MWNYLLFTSSVIRTFLGLPFSNKIQKKNIPSVDSENATDDVKSAELFSAIFFPTNSPTNGIVFFILLVKGKPTNVLIRLFVTNNRLRIDNELKEQH